MKRPIDYLYLQFSAVVRKRICVKERILAGIRMIEVCIPEKEKMRWQNNRWKERQLMRWKKRLKRKLSSYELCPCAIGGEPTVLQVLGMENAGFLARKRELLSQAGSIFKQLSSKPLPGIRKKLLFFLESGKWTAQELYDMLSIAKNYYEDIFLACKNVLQYENTVKSMFEECGLVISVEEIKNARTGIYDSVIFLVEKWDFCCAEGICFRRAYIVAEWEEGSFCRRMVREKAETEIPVFFSGLCYECNNKKIPYQIAVDLRYQNQSFCEKNDISPVAIYRLDFISGH